MSGVPSMLLGCSLVFDTTVTFTTAGVTRAASVSMAWSSVSNAPTLLSSSAAAAGAGTGAAAAVADFTKLSVATDPTTAIANAPTNRRRVIVVLQLTSHFFIFFSPYVTNC